MIAPVILFIYALGILHGKTDGVLTTSPNSSPPPFELIVTSGTNSNFLQFIIEIPRESVAIGLCDPLTTVATLNYSAKKNSLRSFASWAILCGYNRYEPVCIAVTCNSATECVKANSIHVGIRVLAWIPLNWSTTQSQYVLVQVDRKKSNFSNSGGFSGGRTCLVWSLLNQAYDNTYNYSLSPEVTPLHTITELWNSEKSDYINIHRRGRALQEEQNTVNLEEDRNVISYEPPKFSDVYKAIWTPYWIEIASNLIQNNPLELEFIPASKNTPGPSTNTLTIKIPLQVLIQGVVFRWAQLTPAVTPTSESIWHTPSLALLCEAKCNQGYSTTCNTGYDTTVVSSEDIFSSLLFECTILYCPLRLNQLACTVHVLQPTIPITIQSYNSTSAVIHVFDDTENELFPLLMPEGPTSSLYMMIQPVQFFYHDHVMYDFTQWDVKTEPPNLIYFSLFASGFGKSVITTFHLSENEWLILAWRSTPLDGYVLNTFFPSYSLMCDTRKCYILICDQVTKSCFRMDDVERQKQGIHVTIERLDLDSNESHASSFRFNIRVERPLELVYSDTSQHNIYVNAIQDLGWNVGLTTDEFYTALRTTIESTEVITPTISQVLGINSTASSVSISWNRFYLFLVPFNGIIPSFPIALNQPSPNEVSLHISPNDGRYGALGIVLSEDEFQFPNFVCVCGSYSLEFCSIYQCNTATKCLDLFLFVQQLRDEEGRTQVLTWTADQGSDDVWFTRPVYLMWHEGYYSADFFITIESVTANNEWKVYTTSIIPTETTPPFLIAFIPLVKKATNFSAPSPFGIAIELIDAVGTFILGWRTAITDRTPYEVLYCTGLRAGHFMPFCRLLWCDPPQYFVTHTHTTCAPFEEPDLVDLQYCLDCTMFENDTTFARLNATKLSNGSRVLSLSRNMLYDTRRRWSQHSPQLNLAQYLSWNTTDSNDGNIEKGHKSTYVSEQRLTIAGENITLFVTWNHYVVSASPITELCISILQIAPKKYVLKVNVLFASMLLSYMAFNI